MCRRVNYVRLHILLNQAVDEKEKKKLIGDVENPEKPKYGRKLRINKKADTKLKSKHKKTYRHKRQSKVSRFFSKFKLKTRFQKRKYKLKKRN